MEGGRREEGGGRREEGGGRRAGRRENSMIILITSIGSLQFQVAQKEQ